MMNIFWVIFGTIVVTVAGVALFLGAIVGVVKLAIAIDQGMECKTVTFTDGAYVACRGSDLTITITRDLEDNDTRNGISSPITKEDENAPLWDDIEGEPAPNPFN